MNREELDYITDVLGVRQVLTDEEAFRGDPAVAGSTTSGSSASIDAAFVVPDNLSGEANALLQKIQSATPVNDITVFKKSDLIGMDVSEFARVILFDVEPAKWAAVEMNAHVTVGATHIFKTHGLENMLADAALKKVAWSQLQEFAKVGE